MSNKTYQGGTFSGSPQYSGSSGSLSGGFNLREASNNGSHFVAVQAAASIGSSFILTLPDNDGDSGYVLSTDGSGNLSWVAPLTNPMDSEGDLIVGGSAGAATKLDHAGTANRVLRTTSSTGVAWGQLVNADVDTNAAIARSKSAAGTANHVVINDGSGVFSSEATLANSRGGTGTGTYTTGDTLYASSTNTLSKRSIGNNNAINYVSSGVPAWTTATALGFDGSKLLVGNATGTTGDRLATKASGASSTTISVEDDNSTTQQFTLGLTSGAATMTLRDAAGNADTVINGETISTYTNGIQVGDGSAGSPSLTFTSDPNTGIYSAGADTVGIAANGNLSTSFAQNTVTFPGSSVLVKSTKNTPEADANTLQIYSTGASWAESGYTAGAGSGVLQWRGGRDLILYEGTTPRLRIGAGGAYEFNSGSNTPISTNSGTGSYYVGTTTGVGIYQATVTSASTTCTSACSSASGTRGYTGSSCISAWDSSSVDIGCASSTNITKRCLCSGVKN
jgi:hypothetical protein